MLSIAIKNSVILALVILIAHFLLKNNAEDQETRPVATSRITSDAARQPQVKEHRPDDYNIEGRKKHGEDLYSYVYGQGSQVGESPVSLASKPKTISPPVVQFSPPPPPMALPPIMASSSPSQQGLEGEIGGMLLGYEAGTNDQWAGV